MASCNKKPSSKHEEDTTDFLFLNYDQSMVRPRIRPKEVHTHVQVSRRKRKPEKAKPSPQNSPAIVIANTNQSKSSLRFRNGQIEARPCTTRRRNRGKSFTDASLSSKQSRREKLTTTSKLRWADHTSLTKLAVRKGNSDPFSALPVAVTPGINFIISWHRELGLPALYPVERAVLGSPTPAFQRKWRHLVSSVQNEFMIYPYLASVCALMSRVTNLHRVYRDCLLLKHAGYGVTRTRLKNLRRFKTEETYDMILCMCWAEIATGCDEAAEAHLVMLVRLLLSFAKVREIDHDFRVKLLSSDIMLAISRLRPPLLRPRLWAAEICFVDWMAELDENTNRYIVMESLSLDDSLTDQTLRSILFRVRELQAVKTLVSKRKLTKYSVFQWMDLRLLTCESELMTRWVDCADFDAVEHSCSPEQSQPALSLTCVCIAALAWTSSIYGSANRDLPAILEPRLRRLIMQSGLVTRVPDTNQNLVLWLLYVGSMLEVGSSSAKGHEGSRTWYSVKLKAQAQKMGLVSQDQLDTVLRRFLYSPLHETQ